MEKIRKVYIDCGTWTGDSVLEFLRYNPSYEVFAFECEPRLKQQLTTLSEQLGFIFFPKAAWVHDNPIQLYQGIGDYTQSSSLAFNKKKYIDKKHPIMIPAMNFPKWILDNFKKEDYIICKMNIEGAEYQLLSTMLKNGSIDYINKLYVAWHYGKLEGMRKKEHYEIANAVSERTTVIPWNYIEGQTENPFK